MYLNDRRRRHLSKFMSVILRHEPEKFGINLDEHGFVPIAELMKSLAQENFTEEDVRETVSKCDKQRFEITDDRIRAKWGHSVTEKIAHPEIVPPEFLFHGTSPEVLKQIRTGGLKAMSRQYVHLSAEKHTAETVGKRHHPTPVILTVLARKARAAGVKFYNAPVDGELAMVYLADSIPADHIIFPGDGDRFSRLGKITK